MSLLTQVSPHIPPSPLARTHIHTSDHASAQTHARARTVIHLCIPPAISTPISPHIHSRTSAQQHPHTRPYARTHAQPLPHIHTHRNCRPTHTPSQHPHVCMSTPKNSPENALLRAWAQFVPLAPSSRPRRRDLHQQRDKTWFEPEPPVVL
jgi:hypothetical protein